MPLHFDDPEAPGNLSDVDYHAAWVQRQLEPPMDGDDECSVPLPVLRDITFELDKMDQIESLRPQLALPEPRMLALPGSPMYYNAGSWISNQGAYRTDRPWGKVIHTLEAPIRAGIGKSLSEQGGWLDTSNLSPHRLTDPSGTANALSVNLVGSHVGGGNPYTNGYEHAGRAAMSTSEWLDDGLAQQTLDNGARVIAWDMVNQGWNRSEIRWLSGAQIRSNAAGSTFIRGLLTHNDVSQFIGGTNHWDPGPGFPFAWFAARVLYWFDVYRGVTSTPEVPETPKDWFDMATVADLEAVVDRKLRQLVPPLTEQTIVKHFGADAVNDPGTALNAGLMVRQNLLAKANMATFLPQITEAVMGRGGRPAGYYPADLLAAMAVKAGVIAPSAPTEPEPPAEEPKTHTVKAGETLSGIAAQYGVTVAQLQEWNSITNPDEINVDQVLRVSGN